MKIFKFTLFIVSTFLLSHNSFAQTVRELIEGRYFKDSQTGYSFKYGYISSLNTYGITGRTADGGLADFINCSVNESSDGQYMVLTYCFSPITNGTLGKIEIYKDRLILNGSDGTLTFYLDSEGSSSPDVEVKRVESSLLEGNGSRSKIDKTIIPSQIIGNSIKIGQLEIAQNDFNWEMSWDDAKKSIEQLGEGWRLPTKSEFGIIIKNKSSLVFGGDTYWTSTKFREEDVNPEYYWYYNFDPGASFGRNDPGAFECNTDKGAWLNVRAVRTTK